MSDDITPISPADIIPDTHDDSTTDISRAELEAIADDALGTDTPPRKLWGYLNGGEAARTHAVALALRSGYPADRLTNTGISAEIRRIIGLMSDRGISRAYAYRIMTGFTPAKVAETLAKCMDAEDDRVRVRAAEVSSKCLGMQTSDRGVTVNVGVSVRVQAPADPDVQAICDDSD